MNVRFRPLPTWPHPETPVFERRHMPFTTRENPDSYRRVRTPWRKTLWLLGREIELLGADTVLIGAGFTERDIRIDGWPKADAKPRHPGVEVTFDSRYGRLTYATDTCDSYLDNIRSIALGLEALRAVDRYGVGRRGEQYAGWKALPGTALGGMTPESARKLLLDVVGPGAVVPVDGDEPALRALWRAAAKKAHPDTGGSLAMFQAVQEAARVLGIAA